MEAIGLVVLIAALALGLSVKLIRSLSNGLSRTISSSDPAWRRGVEDDIMRREVARKFGPDALPYDHAVSASALKVQMSAPRFISTLLMAFGVFVGFAYFVNPRADPFLVFLFVWWAVWSFRRSMWKRALKREVSTMLRQVPPSRWPPPQ